MIQNVFFDCDSTLVQVEGVVELARLKNKTEEVQTLTEQAMRGEVELSEVFAKRLDIIQPHKNDLMRLGELYCERLTEGAAEAVSELQKLGRQVFIISAGYLESLRILGRKLNIPETNIFGVELIFDENGQYLGLDQSQVLISHMGKKKLLQTLNIDLSQTTMIGDGANDIATQDVVKLFIGFQGNSENKFMKDNAKVFLPGNSLLPVVDMIINHNS